MSGMSPMRAEPTSLLKRVTPASHIRYPNLMICGSAYTFTPKLKMQDDTILSVNTKKCSLTK